MQESSSRESLADVPRFKTWAMALALCAACFAVYAFSLDGPFAMDDRSSISDNLIVANGSLSFDTLLKTLRSSEAPRLIPAMSFVVNKELWGLDGRVAFRLVNVVIHCANAILLLFIGFRLLRHALPGGPWRMASFCAALLWALNPVCLTSVVYIVQRANSLAALFCLGAFLCYLAGRERSGGGVSWPLFGLGAAFWLCAMLCKQISAPLPLMALLCEALVFGRRDRRFLAVAAGLCAAAGALGFLAAGFTLNWDFGSVFKHYEELDFTLGERLLSEPRAVMTYLLAFLLPLPGLLRLDFDDFAVSRGLLSPPSTLLALLAALALLALGVRLFKKAPLISFCVAWFFGMLFVESSFISLELAYLHRAYLPTAAIALAASFLAFERRSSAKAALLLCSVAALYGASTLEWSLAWRSEESLWRSELEKSPGNLRALVNLGIACQNKGQSAKALSIYDKALSLEPGLWRCHYNKGIILMEAGDYAGAEASLREALRLLPGNPELNKALGVLMAKAGRAEEAAKLFEKGASPQTDKSGGADYNAGVLAASKGDFQEAAKRFGLEIERNPSDWKSWKSLGSALASLGRVEEAAPAYAKALELNDSCEEAALGLGLALFNMGRAKESVPLFRKALALKPSSDAAERGLGASLAMSGELKEAEAHLKRALELEPASPETRNALGGVYAMSGRFKEAEAEFVAALRLKPDDPSANANLKRLRARLGAK